MCLIKILVYDCHFINLKFVIVMASSVTQTTTAQQRVLILDDINPNLKAMEYAVRGPILTRAGEIEKEILNVSYIY